MSKFSQNYFFTVGAMLATILMIRHGVDVKTAILGGVGAMVLLGLFRLLQLVDFDNCPRMILGWNCRGKTCDHSPEEVARAKAVMRQR